MGGLAAPEDPRILWVNRLAGWLGLGIQLALLSVPFALSIAGAAGVDVGTRLGFYYVWYLWTGFPFVTLFIAWLFMRGGAFRAGGRSWWGLLATFGTLLLWVIVLICHVEGIGLGGTLGTNGLR